MLNLQQFRDVMDSNINRARFDEDEIVYLKQFLPSIREIEARYHVDGPGNWIIVYMTTGDIRVCCFASYDEYGRPNPHIVWDNPA